MCAKSCKACCKILIGAIIFIALVAAVAVSAAPQQTMPYLVFVSRFFDVMIPVLGVGALLKYLLCHHSCHCGDKKEDSSCCSHK